MTSRQATTSYCPETLSRSFASHTGDVAGGAAPFVTSPLYRRSASPTIFAEMSDAVTAAPRSATGMASEPVPQPQSHTLVPFTPPSPSSQPRTLSTVCAWPVRMSSCTLLTSSVSP